MDAVAQALKLSNEGRYGAALRSMEVLRSSSLQPFSVQILRAELLEAVGNYEASHELTARMLRSPRLPDDLRARGEYVIGRVSLENGRTDEGLNHLQRALSLSAAGTDLRLWCWVQSSLMVIVGDRSGPDAAAPLLAELRRNVTKLGDPQSTARLHLFVGEMDARQGRLDSAIRHVRLGQDLLRAAPHAWLEAYAENVLLAACLIRSELDEAKVHSRLALALADESGAAAPRRSAAANTGNLHFLCGDFDQAFSYFQLALSIVDSTGDKNSGVLDALAQVCLTQGRLHECEEFLKRIDEAIINERDRTFYGPRYGELTRTRLMARQGRIDDALQHIEYVQALSERTGDQILLKIALLAKAEFLVSANRYFESIATLDEVMRTTAGHTPEVFARYLNIASLIIARHGNSIDAHACARRAQRFCEIATNAPALHDFKASGIGTGDTSPADQIRSSDNQTESAGRDALYSLVAILLHTSRPELIASELAELLLHSGCARAVKIVSVERGSADERVIRMVGDREPNVSDKSERFVVGEMYDRAVELVVFPHKAHEATLIFNCLGPLIEQIRSLEQTRKDRERRSALWPVDEMASQNSKAVISGHLRDLMTIAQRVARTTVNVLITGESGTGKEILARALHDFSDRAHKPFVPVNCAAVPRELLESQLFGHRRGAFTGADRDHAGLIRAAADGTLFLDEIADLSLDLQPKLLRFLESGEIAPLGEPSPLTVNVRVLAATNTNLEDSVRDGRFREDLFYRLNVVRFSIKPLRERRDEIPGMIAQFVAAAARDFNKGNLEVAEDTMERLLLYRWPGNVRQLLNELRRIVALAEPNSTIEPAAISPAIISALPDLRRTSLNGCKNRRAARRQAPANAVADRVRDDQNRPAHAPGQGRRGR
jgi:DNA-binding NtrC family response regulator/tetratricopeptide (TPR) repeat protein